MPWISNNTALNIEDQTNNALMVWSFFNAQGWTANAVAGMLGNMVAESTINPGRWEIGHTGDTDFGFGLVQWTPASKLFSWLSANGYPNGSGDGQCRRIIWELDNGEQYYPTSNYPLSFREFSISDERPSYLAAAFLYNYERPGDPEETMPYRQNQADYWYTVITGEPPPPYVPPGSGMLPFIFWGKKQQLY